VRAAVKLYRRSRGLTLIGLWAFAPPVFIQSEGDGGLSFSIGAGAGQYELVSRSCAGEFLSSRPVPYRTGGALVEFEPSDLPFRVSGFGGANLPVWRGVRCRGTVHRGFGGVGG
jgi:hypothetical protein